MAETNESFFDRISDPIAAAQMMGEWIARSGMFGCETKEAGMVLALECLTKKISPLELAHRYHMIHGRLSTKTDYMLSQANKAGWSHKVIERSPEAAEIVLIHKDGRAFSPRLTWEQAKAEPFPYEGKERDIIEGLKAGKPPRLKSKYETPRSRTQMLWARVVSDAIRTIDPSCNHGEYTTEEIEDEQELQGRSATHVAPKSEVIMPPVVVTQQTPVNASSPAITYTPPSTVAEPVPKQAEFSSTDDGVCTPAQASRVKALLEEIEQLRPGTSQAFVHSMQSKGLKLTHLSNKCINALIAKLEVKAIEEFFAVSLERGSPSA